VQDVAPALAVAVPELLLAEDASGRAAHESREPHAHWKVEPDDEVRGLRDEISDRASIRAVDDPALSLHDRLDARAQLVGRARLPVGSVVKRVELVVGDVHPLGQSLSRRRLAAAASRRDKADAPQWHPDGLVHRDRLGHSGDVTRVRPPLASRA
jgi:hypothetical protein